MDMTPKRRMRLLGMCVTVVAALSTGVLPASGSTGTTGTPSQSKPETSAAEAAALTDAEARAGAEAQAPLVAAASRIQRAVDSGHDAGYAGIGLEDDHVVVWWKGARPAAVRRAISEARRTVTVRVEPAAHSRAELEAAAQEATDFITAHPDAGYHSVEVAYDGSEVVVNVDPASGRSATTAALPSAMDLPAGVPVRVQAKAPADLTGRLDDGPPYWGGGRITNTDNGGQCTAGWPVFQGGTEYMLTAGHCGRSGGGWNNGNNTRFFGTGSQEHVAHDLLLVRADVGPRMWDGGVGSGEFTKHVAGSGHTFPGEGLCASGSISGVQCGYTVTSTFTFSFLGQDVYGNWETYEDLVLASYCCGTASRRGDSGGPVFAVSGASDVIAKGTITGVADGGATLIFQDFVTAQNDFGINVAT